jgi:peptide deformylase
VKSHIVQIGDPGLRSKSKLVPKKDIGSRKLAGIILRMKNLLKKEEFGVAIAAPQIGEPLRIFIVSGKAFAKSEAKEDKREKVPTPEDMVFINPELVRLSKKKKQMSEGCLSVRGEYGSVLRNEKATVKALDEKGKSFTHHGSELIAQIFQHELDHLEGILFIDKATKLEEKKNE